MTVKIFINDKPLVFSTDDFNTNLPYFMQGTSYQNLLNYFIIEEFYGGQIKTEDVEYAFKKFSEQLIIIEAAGGVVYNDEEKILLIKRFGKWDLPKGKIERIETPKHAAMREVCEETGVCDLETFLGGIFFDKSKTPARHPRTSDPPGICHSGPPAPGPLCVACSGGAIRPCVRFRRGRYLRRGKNRRRVERCERARASG